MAYKKRKIYKKPFTRIIIILPVIIAIIALIFTVLQTNISRLALDDSRKITDLESKNVENNQKTTSSYPELRYYVVGLREGASLLSKWIKPGFPWTSENQKDTILRQCLLDLSMVSKPFIVNPQVDPNNITTIWNNGKIWPENIGKNRSIIDLLTNNNSFWLNIIKSNNFTELNTDSIENIISGHYSQPLKNYTGVVTAVPALAINITNVNETIISVGIKSCYGVMGDLAYPEVKCLFCDLTNFGITSMEDIVISGKYNNAGIYKINYLDSNINGAKEWTQKIPIKIKSGEHILLYLGIILAKTYPWPMSEQKVFTIGPFLIISDYEYNDQINQNKRKIHVRNFIPSEILSITDHIGIGSCPFIVFYDLYGNKLSERRVLIDACGAERENRETLRIPTGSVLAIISEREREISYLKNVTLFSESFHEKDITHEYRQIKLSQGEEYKIDLNNREKYIIIDGYYILE